MRFEAVAIIGSNEFGPICTFFTSNSSIPGLMGAYVFARFPTADETAVGVKHLKKYANNRRAAAEDLAWALLNSTEFLFNH